jgi:hypothetical protein
MEPSKTPLDSPFAEPIRAAIVAAQEKSRCWCPPSAAACRTTSYLILGIPAFNVPSANADESNHAPNENLRSSASMPESGLARRC